MRCVRSYINQAAYVVILLLNVLNYHLMVFTRVWFVVNTNVVLDDLVFCVRSSLYTILFVPKFNLMPCMFTREYHTVLSLGHIFQQEKRSIRGVASEQRR